VEGEGTPGPPIVEANGLVKTFAEARAVDGIDLEIPAGGVYGLLGPNGAGKTTTIRILAGLLWPTRGSVRVLGQPVRPGAPVLRRVGCLIERPALYPWLSATDNLRVFATMRGIASAEQPRMVDEALSRVGLGGVARRKAGGFSTGMRQRLALAAAFLGRPELVVLDEPTNGLDPNGVVDVRGLIKALARDGTTIILSSHVLPEVEQLCDRIAIMRDGRIAASGPARDVLGTGERLYVRFDGAADADAALRLVGDRRPSWTVARDGATALVVDAPAAQSSGLNRLLGEASLYPAELGVRRPSLEAVFRELTLDQPGVAGEAVQPEVAS
jgi:ABC-2 type transport system ATP-binding protein